MLKLIGQNFLSTKTGHNYWKYSMYSDAISRHIEWIIENIENSKDDHIVRVNDFVKELGPNFAINHYTFTGLRYALFKEGIIIDAGKKIPDFFFCIGYNESRTEVLCVYIIANENIKTNAIHINKNWAGKNWGQQEDPYYWYKQDPKPWNEDCPVLKTRS